MAIHYLEADRGGPEDPVLLMVHGWTGSAANFQDMIRVLSPPLRSIAVDLPGCGFSDKPDAPYDAAWFVEFLRSFCVRQGLRTVVLIGHSMGGHIAIHFASRHPGMVERLILIDPNGMQGEEGLRGSLAHNERLVELAFRLNNRLFIEWALRVNIFYDAPPEILKAGVESTASSTLGPQGVRAIRRITRAMIGRDPVDSLLPGVTQETLLVWGDHDRLLPPRWALSFARLLPRADLRIVSPSGHMPMSERPRETAALIEGFISGGTRAPQPGSPPDPDPCRR